jgi:hypothetical protein
MKQHYQNLPYYLLIYTNMQHVQRSMLVEQGFNVSHRHRKREMGREQLEEEDEEDLVAAYLHPLE